MRRSDFSYYLPPDRIAQVPAEPRDRARLLVLRRDGPMLTDATFSDLPGWLSPGDVLVANDTRVVPARLRGTKDTGGRAEALLVAREGARRWEALLGASKRSRPGARIRLSPDASLRVLEERGSGLYLVELEAPAGVDADAALETLGEVPLPPYIRRERPDPRDRARYQTLFAHPDKGGSAAAPTAGLHFTPGVLEALAARGILCVTVTLHVGPGTFLPVRVDDVSEHRMHREWYQVSASSSSAVNRALDEGHRVVAVGTTATRVLEHCGRSGRVEPGSGWTELFLRPGHEFRIIKGLVTNFHLPESTLLMLVCAFAGRDPVLSAYQHAVGAGYRFFSYGDAMLLL
ncbi:MAG: tRNA preQ1(34) S-adenosylmethionine ribosyltransferase-isomerase QueA [Deltaproteobacteria bacterium]|nr:tRNA preQ1(34) S-adenosylmethionine ribosyltransferase-isomerase QueA [Deltaproteobacteria bacterium]